MTVDGSFQVSKQIIDTNFNFYTDANGGDPDSTSPTLRKYHRLLWSKTLPNGRKFELTDRKSGAYLYHKSDLGEYFFGSDAIYTIIKCRRNDLFPVN